MLSLVLKPKMFASTGGEHLGFECDDSSPQAGYHRTTFQIENGWEAVNA